jgi:broad specificity phosphatase PhoE
MNMCSLPTNQGKPMKLTLIRHAESERNKTRRGEHFYKDNDQKLGTPNHKIKLTEEGVAQAKQVAKKLFDESQGEGGSVPHVIFHSGYERSKKTAHIILEEVTLLAEQSGVTLIIPTEQDHLLRERDAGYGIEMTEDESRGHFPFLNEYWKFDGMWFAVPPGGESVIQVMDRVNTFLIKLALSEKLKSKHIWAVTHGRTMSAFQMVIEKIPFEDADENVVKPHNCATATYEYKEGEWQTLVV